MTSDATPGVPGAGEGEGRVAEIEARANAATPGPWVYMTDPTFWGEIRSAAEGGSFAQIADTPEYDERDKDMEFIAHAREDIPWLLAALRAKDAALRAEAEARAKAEGERDRLREAVDLQQDLIAKGKELTATALACLLVESMRAHPAIAEAFAHRLREQGEHDQATAFEQFVEAVKKNEAERKATDAVLARLPVTADGVPIVPGMNVWRRFGTDRAIRELGIDAVYSFGGVRTTVALEDPKTLYSSESAARAAAGGESGGAR